MSLVRAACASLVLYSTVSGAQTVQDIIPAAAPNCSVVTPPSDAGLVATPGGFVLVYPRNAGLSNTYTGCKSLWIADTDRTPRFATLYFEAGQLRIAAAHDPRDPAAKLEGACAFPEGKSLLPQSGRQFADSACQGFHEDAFYGLHVPTWPRICMTAPENAVCQRDPE